VDEWTHRTKQAGRWEATANTFKTQSTYTVFNNKAATQTCLSST